MIRKSLITSRLTAILIFGLLISAGLQSQNVPISFNEYHGYTGSKDYLEKVSRAYPDITELINIGESTMGRPIYILAISNMKNGTTIDKHVVLYNKREENVDNVPLMKSHQGKPGHFIGGSTHGNEYTGTEVCLYIIDRLINAYGKDEQITTLVDNNVFYLCPTINPDGVFNSVEKGLAQRPNSMLKDNDNDGKINEDGLDDINGDGKMTSFRYKDDKGSYIIDDLDPRIMIRLQREQETDKQRYSVVREDIDNDGDGKRGEDSESGIDLNRNYPEGWWNEQGFAGGTGDYPTSAPETHALAEFFTNYRNIIMAQFYHTSGGFTYRPMGTAPHTEMAKEDVAIFDLVMGKKYLELIGEEVPEAWAKPEKTDQLKKELAKSDANKYAKMRGYVLPRGWRVSYNENSDRRYNYGMATDWLYAQYGIYSITTELWNPAADIFGLDIAKDNNNRLATERAVMAYQDKEYDGNLFVEWQAFNHPELGKGEVGGWISQYARNNAFPGAPLLDVCKKHYEFEIFRASLLPRIEIKDIKTEILYTAASTRDGEVEGSDAIFKVTSGKSRGKYHLVKITATIENTGDLATNLARGAQLPGNRDDVVRLIGEKGEIEFIEGQPSVNIGSLGGRLKVPGVKNAPGSRTVEWIIALKDKSDLKIVASSLKGGTKVQNITVK